MKSNKDIIIHCSATPEGRDVDIETVRGWHKGRGWRDVGYHYFVKLDGTVQVGRKETDSGAHTIGHNNDIGVCYAGGMNIDMTKPMDTRTEEQKQAIIDVIKDIKTRYPDAKVYGHRDFSAKACPSFDAKEEYKDM